MSHRFFQLKEFILHWLWQVDAHSIHSPFFFDFYTHVIRPKNTFAAFEDIEQLRQDLLANTSTVPLADLGAPSPHFNSATRSIQAIAKTSLVPTPWAHLFFRIAAHLRAKRIVELGTSMGITTLYLSRIKDAAVFTFEGNRSMASIAQTHFEALGARHVTLVEGLIDKTLPDFLQNPAKIDLAIIDANHRLDPTLRYFEWLSKRMSDQGVIILDDIHHSPEMTQAWNTLKQHTLVYATMDLFRCGLLFFNPDLHREHYTCSL